MFYRIKRLAAGLTIATMLMTTAVVPKTAQPVIKAEAASLSATVNKNFLRIYTKKTVNSKSLVTLHKGDSVKVFSTGTRWVKIKTGKTFGYAYAKYLTTSRGGTAADKDGKDPNASRGQQVASFALKFVGNPYRWGGTSLTHGADCSGFVMSVYRHFGKSLPHSSAAQRSVGRSVGSLSAARPGDIICYSGHVAIYLGNRRIVHASNPSTGIKISSNAAYRHIVSIRRIF